MPHVHDLVSSRRRSGPGALVLFAGPCAWFAELNLGYLMATEPCFPTDHRLIVPDEQWAWTHVALIVLAIVCLLVALGGFVASMRALPGRSAHARTAPGGRPEFAAFWGVAFGGGFFVATLLSFVGLIVLPRCGG